MLANITVEQLQEIRDDVKMIADWRVFQMMYIAGLFGLLALLEHAAQVLTACLSALHTVLLSTLLCIYW
jgi:glutaredoxin-related protein